MSTNPTYHPENADLHHDEPKAAPSLWLGVAEFRSIGEFFAGMLTFPWLRRLPRGDGHPVLVLPGFGGFDATTLPLRYFLRKLGYIPYGWGQGTNRGITDQTLMQLTRRLEEIHSRHQKKVSLIGWSLGGVIAREVARKHVDWVRSVITLGSPLRGNHKTSRAWPLYKLLNRKRLETDLAPQAVAQRMQPLPVPFTSIYSRSDGIVAWPCATVRKSKLAENIEVHCSHTGFGHHPHVLYAIADRLAQPQDGWVPFHREGLRQRFYPHASGPIPKTA
jgi:pimeloyl-ACP methyl ester carboxylesterase